MNDSFIFIMQKSEIAYNEKNRASAAVLNAEDRRTKARLMDEVPKLRKLTLKKVKGLSSEESIRNDMVLALPERIQAIPDGITGAAANQAAGVGLSPSSQNIKFDSSGDKPDKDMVPFE